MMRSITGGFRWLVVVIACVWLMFLLDWFADLPMALRVGQIAATVTLLLITFRAILLAVRTPATEDQLASMVENASSELEDSLITAVQLTDPENPRRHLYNPELIKETVKIAESRIAHLRPEGCSPGAVPSRRSVCYFCWSAPPSSVVGCGPIFFTPSSNEMSCSGMPPGPVLINWS
jgi:hypothetical protein